MDYLNDEVTPLITESTSESTPVDANTSVSAPLEDSNSVSAPLKPSTSVSAPLEDSTSVSAPLEDSTSVSAPLEDSTSVSAPLEDSTSVSAPLEDSTSVSAPLEDSTSVSAPLEDSNSVSAPLEDSTSVSAPLEDSTSVSAPLEDSTSVSAPLEDSTSVSAPLEDSTSVSAPLEESTSVSAPLEDSTSVSAPLEASTSVSAPLEDSTSVSAPLEASTSVSAPLEDSTSVSAPLEASTSVSAPLEDSTSVSAPLEASTSVSAPLENSTSVSAPLEDSTSVSASLNASTNVSVSDIGDRFSAFKNTCGKREVNILVAGKTGFGKSTLVNILVGEEVAKVGETLFPETVDVNPYRLDGSGVDVVIWDTPGLQDGSGKERKYAAKMRKKCARYDLVMYCMSMVEPRIREDDIKAITTMTKEFGERIWENAIFVLTFANHVVLTVKTPKEVEERYKQLCEAIPKLLIGCKVSEKLATNIAVIPTGFTKGDGKGRKLPPITKDWLSNFWFASLLRMTENAQRDMLQANKHRFKQTMITKDDLRKPAHQQPLTPLDTMEAVVITFGVYVSSVTVCTLIGGLVGIVGGPPGVVAGGMLGSALGIFIGSVTAPVVGATYWGIKQRSKSKPAPT